VHLMCTNLSLVTLKIFPTVMELILTHGDYGNRALHINRLYKPVNIAASAPFRFKSLYELNCVESLFQLMQLTGEWIVFSSGKCPIGTV